MKDGFAKRYFIGSAVITVFLALLCWRTTPSPALYRKIPLSLYRLLSVPFTSGELAFQSDPIEDFDIRVLDEGQLIFVNHGETSYRYGPSIMRHEDGSMDVWFASQGNSSSEWDWIRYRHSTDGVNWGQEKIVLRPTRYSQDRCSVCDPGAIYFNGYYYLAYTSTDNYSLKGYDNSVFVARSSKPEGPYEKWNGSGWGGKPVPILTHEYHKGDWGIGEPSLVVYNDELYIYYSRYDADRAYIGLAKADLSENWPATIVDHGKVCDIDDHDSFDVVYDERLDRFMAFAVRYKLSDASKIVMYVSKNGMELFEEVDVTDHNISKYAHSLGISKDELGHIDSSEEQIIGYAFGPRWGRWSARFHRIMIEYSAVYE